MRHKIAIYSHSPQGRSEGEMEVSLNDMKPGDSARVTGFSKGLRDYRQRLLAMGLTPGAVFSVTRVAPLGISESRRTEPDGVAGGDGVARGVWSGADIGRRRDCGRPRLPGGLRLRQASGGCLEWVQ
jgi:Fe2+ transport system protein FeoA